MKANEKKGMVQESKEQIVSMIEGASDVASAITDAVSNTIAHAVKGTRSVGGELVGLTVDTVTA
ncbi:MAG: hypothetical protein ACRENN_06180, partial [Candidatus Eiseniibacteriota bacterium]